MSHRVLPARVFWGFCRPIHITPGAALIRAGTPRRNMMIGFTESGAR
jgi:hypothetical protein